MQRFTGPPRPERRPVAVAVAMAAFLVVCVAAVVTGVPSSTDAIGQATIVELATHVGPETPSVPGDGFLLGHAVRRDPSAPAAVLAAAVVVTSLTVGRRFVPLPRPGVRSWAGDRARRDRAPPIPAV